MTIVDVFPNIIRGEITQSAANAYVQEEIATGLNAVTSADLMQQAAEKRKKSGMPETIVGMELLKIKLQDLPTLDAAGEYFRVGVSTVSDDTAVQDLKERGVLGRIDRIYEGAGSIQELTGEIDFTAGGVGRLVCSRSLYIQLKTNGLASAVAMDFQIVFRYVNLTFYEFFQIQEGQRNVTG